MKIKDYFTSGVTLVTVNDFLYASNFRLHCKNGVRVEVILIDSKFYCNVSAYCDKSLTLRLHLAMFPIKSSYTSCQVVNLAIRILNDMGYIKSVKK